MLCIQSAGTDKHDAKMIGYVVVFVDRDRVLDFAKVRSLTKANRRCSLSLAVSRALPISYENLTPAEASFVNAIVWKWDCKLRSEYIFGDRHTALMPSLPEPLKV